MTNSLPLGSLPLGSLPLRPVTDQEIASFWRDGVVCLYGILDPTLVESMAAPIDRLLHDPAMADMSAMGDALAASGEKVLIDDTQASQRGTFRSGVDHWRDHEAFRAFSCDSPLPQVIGDVLQASKINLWEDSVLVKEPGTRERTAWHQDIGYFHVEGTQLCTSWIPLDAVDGASGAMSFVKGSHRGEIYRPNLFVTTMDIPETLGASVPDIDALALAGDVELISFDLGPGDLTVHHARTLHAAGGNTTVDRRRRAISVRYCGDDARYFMRSGAPKKPHHHHVNNGDPLDSDDCPVVWRRDSTA
jgi:ectoine hydroxylase-related dioxygenase (phytanoyl-CoA dioxygenase family)